MLQSPSDTLLAIRGAGFDFDKPALVIRQGVADFVMDVGPLLLVVLVTTARRGLPSHIEIDPGHSGLDDVSYAKCEDIKSMSDRRLATRLGVTEPDGMFNVGRVLAYLLDL